MGDPRSDEVKAQETKVCPKCSMLYFREPGKDAYCPACGWEYETARREMAVPMSRRERQRRRSLFPIDLSDETFFLDGSEYEYSSVRDLVFWFTARAAPWFGRSAPLNRLAHEYLLSFRAGDTPISLTRKDPPGGAPTALSTGENYLIQIYRAIRSRSFHERVAERRGEIVGTGRAVFGKLTIGNDRTFKLGRRSGSLLEHDISLHGSDLCAERSGKRRPLVCVPSRGIPDLDVALALIRRLKDSSESF